MSCLWKDLVPAHSGLHRDCSQQNAQVKRTDSPLDTRENPETVEAPGEDVLSERPEWFEDLHSVV